MTKSIMYLLLLLFFLTQRVSSQNRTNFELAISEYLKADFEKSNFHLTNALNVDSLVFEYYYFKGYNYLQMQDTAFAINQFNLAIKAKKLNNVFSNDSIAIGLMTYKPKYTANRICHIPGPPEPLDLEFHKIVLATWLFLKEKNIDDACKIYRNLYNSNFKQVEPLLCELCACAHNK